MVGVSKNFKVIVVEVNKLIMDSGYAAKDRC